MALLTGLTQDGTEVPVQVDGTGRLVAEGLTGPAGPAGPAGPTGPQGDGSVWQRSGTVVSPATAGDIVSANGFKFPGTSVAASDPNTLDDYEEGTFTPTIVGATTAGVGTYIRQVGRYTKIGNRVLVNLFVTWTAHTGTGTLQINSLPFTSNSAAVNFSALSLYFYNLAYTAGSTLLANIPPGVSYVQLAQGSNTGVQNVGIPMDTAADICVSGSYEV